jgi:hypothetical protein
VRDSVDRAIDAVIDEIQGNVYDRAVLAVEAGDLRRLFKLAPEVAALPRSDEVEIRRKASEKFGSDFSKKDWAAALKEGREANERFEAPRKPSDKPTIRIVARSLEDIVKDAADALRQYNKPPQLFWRSGGEMVHIRREDGGRPSIQPVTKDFMVLHLARAADFVRGGEKTFSCEPTATIANSVLQLDAAKLDLPKIRGVSEIPIFRPDGSIHAESGYDKATGFFFNPTVTFPDIPADLCTDDVEAAVKRIEDIICDFPFDSQASKANAIGMMLCPLIRNLISGPVPAACIEAPSAGTGKTKLATVAVMLATGDSATFAWKQEERENEVTITAALRDQRPVVCLDNVTGIFGTGSLCAALTSTEVNIRPMGVSRIITVPVHTTWIVTANNIRPGEDMGRRMYKIRIDAKTNRPMQRTNFVHEDLLGYVAAHRGELVHAFMVLAAWWFQQGKPLTKIIPLGSFESWHTTIASILECAGVRGFLANLNETLGQEEGTVQWEGFLTVVESIWGDVPFKVIDIILKLKDTHDGPTLKEAIPPWMPVANEDKLKQVLGSYFSRKMGDRVGEKQYHLVKSGTDAKTKSGLWRVLTAETEVGDAKSEG